MIFGTRLGGGARNLKRSGHRPTRSLWSSKQPPQARSDRKSLFQGFPVAGVVDTVKAILCRFLRE
jgi:hypothetical protein